MSSISSYFMEAAWHTRVRSPGRTKLRSSTPLILKATKRTEAWRWGKQRRRQEYYQQKRKREQWLTHVDPLALLALLPSSRSQHLIWYLMAAWTICWKVMTHLSRGVLLQRWRWRERFWENNTLYEKVNKCFGGVLRINSTLIYFDHALSR